MKLLTTLKRARVLLAGGWHPLLSLDSSGCICSATAEMVARFSLHDAIEAAAAGDVDAVIAIEAMLTVLADPAFRRTLYEWESESARAPRDVLALFDRGISRAGLLSRGGRS